MAARWEFWIDVGGTFTACLAKAPDGAIRRHKLLSSGVTKGRVGEGSSQYVICDASRRNDPAEFWTGWQLSIVGDDGQVIDRAEVTGFDRVKCRLGLCGLSSSPSLNASYEVSCKLDAPVIAIRYVLGLALAEQVA